VWPGGGLGVKSCLSANEPIQIIDEYSYFLYTSTSLPPNAAHRAFWGARNPQENIMVKYLVLLALFFGMASAAIGQEPSNDNVEMAAIFEADQEVRQSISPAQANDRGFWSRMAAEDEQRRTRTAELLDQGALVTANDFYRAAFIFQHGGEPSSYLIAHTLAVAAASRGHKNGGWIAAASLDRYLQAIGQPQIYGTQTMMPAGQSPTMDPYDRSLIPDSLRSVIGVPGLAEQEKRLEQFREMPPK
jgi:hypothetical protein